MSNSNDQPADTQRFVDALNRLDYLPDWPEAAGLGVPLVDLSQEEFAIREALADLDRADQDFDAIVDPALAEALNEDIADHRRRLEQIEARPGRFFLASGEVIQRDPFNNEAHQSGWWYDSRSVQIATPAGDRVHRPGIHPASSIDPTAKVHRDARVEAGATIGAHARVGAYAHIGRDAALGAHALVQEGAWIGTGTELWPRTWIGEGAMVDPHCTIGHHASVGAGSHVTKTTEIEPYARLGAGTTTSATPTRHGGRGIQIANAVENIMRLDHE